MESCYAHSQPYGTMKVLPLSFIWDGKAVLMENSDLHTDIFYFSRPSFLLFFGDVNDGIFHQSIKLGEYIE